MKKSVETIAFWVTLLIGLGLVFTGSRFLLVTSDAETAFGIKVSTNGNYSFHYIKGIGDIFSGAVITILLLKKEFRASRYFVVASFRWLTFPWCMHSPTTK
jgi:hypothetical protein